MKKLLQLFFGIVLITSCDLNTGEVSLQPDAIGDEGELIVIMPDGMWNGNAGEAMKKAFKKPYLRVTTPQPYFDIRHFSEKELDDNVKKYKNIFYVQIIDNEKYKIPKLVEQENVWAKDQIVFRLFSQTKKAAQLYLEKNGDLLCDRLDELVRKRYMKKFKKHDNKANEEVMAEKFGIYTEFDDDYQVRIDRENFVWFSSEFNRFVQGSGSHPVEMGIIVYQFPYKDEVQLSTKYLNAVRDSVLKANVKGENNSYMVTEYMEDFQPIGKEVNINDTYAKVIRGRYTFKGDFIAGGSFISLSMVHPQTQNVVTLYGFIYAPKFDKREYIRQLEAILYSTYPIDTANKNEQ